MSVQTNAPQCPNVAAFLRDVICSGDNRQYDYLRNWLAWKMQNPLSKPGVAIVLIGEQGTGKGTFGYLMMDVFGKHHSMLIQDTEQLLGKFLGHLEGKLILFVDEAIFGRDPRTKSKYKSLITEPTMLIEHKGHTPRQVQSHFAVIVASNELTAVPVEPGDRRATVIEVSSGRKNGDAYFTNLRRAWVNGEREEFIRHLLARDVSGFNPRIPLNTVAKSAVASATADDATGFWSHVVKTGRLPGGAFGFKEHANGHDWYGLPTTILRKELHDAFRVWGKDNGIRSHVTEAELTRRVGQLCSERQPYRQSSGARERGFTYPTLDRCEQLLNVALGGA